MDSASLQPPVFNFTFGTLVKLTTFCRFRVELYIIIDAHDILISSNDLFNLF